MIVSAATAPPPGFALTAPGLGGFRVEVICTQTPHRERNATYNVYVITATATFGAFGGDDFVSRTLTTTVTNAP